MTIIERLRSSPGLLSTEETAAILGTCEATLRRWIKAKKLSAIRIGPRLKFDPDTVAKFVEARQG